MRLVASHIGSILGRTVALVLMLSWYGLCRPAQADDTAARVPAPTGPYAVGTTTIRLMDATRNDPFLRNGSKRELMVRFWYPAARAGACAAAEYSSPKVWAYLSALGLPPLEVRTNSCRQAAVLPGPHPVIMASHGYTGLFTDYTFLFEDLASRGYVVASIAHTFESTVVETPDGRVLISLLGTHFLEDSLRTDERSIQFASSVRLRDLKFVLTELKTLNETKGPFSGKLDLQRIGVFGHSMGADTAMTSLRRQPDLKAAVLLDPILLSAPSTQGTDKPVLLVSEGREDWSESECELWTNSRGARVAAMFRGAEHLTPTDAVWLGEYLPALHVETGSLGREKTVAAVRSYVSAFFGAYLQGKPPGLLLNGLSTELPDVVITTQTGSLCAQARRSVTGLREHDNQRGSRN
jgi:alpha-beta hydrolase superfamily lysophospholipase